MPIAAATDRATPAALVGRSSAAMIPVSVPMPTPVTVMPDSFAKEAMLAWYRGEFAAANAIIDALCSHMAQLTGGDNGVYKAVFEAIHRRRLNWIPVLQMQKFHSIADVTMELCRVAAARMAEDDGVQEEFGSQKVNDGEKESGKVVNFCLDDEKEKNIKEVTESEENGYADNEEAVEEDDSLNSEITDTVLWRLRGFENFEAAGAERIHCSLQYG